MINFFHFYCFNCSQIYQTTNWSMLIRGDLFAIDWTSQSLCGKPFLMQFLWTIFDHMVLLTSGQMISMASSEMRAKHSRACSSPCHNRVDFGVIFVTQLLLLCNLQLTRDSVSMIVLCRFKLASHVLCKVELLILCWIYHIPCDTAVITVHYHMEVDKLLES